MNNKILIVGIIILIIIVIASVFLHLKLLSAINEVDTDAVIEKVSESIFIADVRDLKDEFTLKAASEVQKNNFQYDITTINANTPDELAQWIPSISIERYKKYADKFIIKNGELVFIGNDEKEIELVSEAGVKLLRDIENGGE